MRNDLLQEHHHWQRYTGQDLSLTGFVHLFKINVDEHYPKLASAPLLSIAEKDKASRLLKSEDQQSYITSKHFLRLILSRFLQTDPMGLVYQYVLNKKPYLPGLHFNLSHSKNQVVIAVSTNALGIDVEHIKLSFVFNDLLDMCFDIPERDFITTGSNQLLNFYTLWTRKEALLKATGEGLVDQLNKVPGIPVKVMRNDQSFAVDSFLAGESYLISLATTFTATTTVLYWEVD
jgi:4'-phosphopantetheinyl transferase